MRVQGPLTEDEVRSGFTDIISAFRMCHNVQLSDHPGLNVTLDLRVNISDGQIIGTPRVRGTQISPLRDCVSRQVRRLRFREHTETAVADVRLRLTFVEQG